MGFAKQIMYYSTKNGPFFGKKPTDASERSVYLSQSNDKPTVKGYSWQLWRLWRVNIIEAAFLTIVSEKLIVV